MKGNFKSELYHLTHSSVLIVAVLVLLVCDLFMSSRSKVTEQNMYDLPELTTMGGYLNFYQTDDNVSSAKYTFIKRGAFTESDAVDLIGVFNDAAPYQFRWILASNKGMLAIPLIVVLVFLAGVFPARSVNNAIYVGKTRSSIFFAKYIFLLILTFVISFIGILLLTVIYAGAVFRTLSPVYVFGCMLLHAFADTALISLTFLFAFLLRNMFLTGVFSLVYCLLIRFTSFIWPAAIKSNMATWESGGSALMLIVPSLIFLLVSIVGSCFSFTKRDMPGMFFAALLPVQGGFLLTDIRKRIIMRKKCRKVICFAVFTI